VTANASYNNWGSRVPYPSRGAHPDPTLLTAILPVRLGTVRVNDDYLDRKTPQKFVPFYLPPLDERSAVSLRRVGVHIYFSSS